MRRMAGGGSFRYTKWDPFLILSQMSALQCIYYVSLGIWIFFFDILSGTPRSLDQIFKYQTLLASSWIGNLQIAAFLFNALTCSLGLWYVVQRTKQCLDYTCTVHLFHVIFCWYFNGVLPNYLSWWIINLICVTVMCVGGEFLCMRTELRAIPVSMSNTKVDL